MNCSERTRHLVAAGALAAALLAGCGREAAPTARVVELRVLPLSGPLNSAEAEVSGMTWYADTLILLPQHPDRFGTGGDLAFFGVPGADILALLDGGRTVPLDPFVVPCAAPWLARMIEGYDGLESLGVIGDLCYLTVEAYEDTTTTGYLVSGRSFWDGEVLSLDLERLASIPLDVNLPEVADETLVVDGERIITIGEANGRNVNPEPRARVFNRDLDYLGALPMPQIEYRVTDATALDEERRVWVLNYFYPPERDLLQPAPDPESARHGAPPWLADDVCLERLLELQITDDDRIVRTDTPPLWLRPLEDGRCRNWEAVVRLGDRGFLLMTDRHPATLLAFVPLPDDLRR
jgi:hypothetical protein